MLEKFFTLFYPQHEWVWIQKYSANPTKSVLERVFNQKPLQYIIGNVQFCDLEIDVLPPILIPRTETEQCIQWCIDTIFQNSESKILDILDICSGSGAPTFAMAQKLTQSHFIGIDIDPQAIKLSQHNRLKLFPNRDIKFQLENLFSWSPENSFDFIYSNPPYLTQSQFDTLDPIVSRWESPRALISSLNAGITSPIDLYTYLIQFCHKWIRSNDSLRYQIVFEIDSPRRYPYSPNPIQLDYSSICLGSQVQTISKQYFPVSDVYLDYFGVPRWLALKM